MTLKDRRDRERDRTRERIMIAARKQFAAEGYEAVSMRRIATEIEYSPTAIYGHFRDKSDLFHAICREDFAALAGAVSHLDKVTDPVERILKIGMAYCRFGLENPSHYRLLFMTPMVPHPDGKGPVAEEHNPDTDSWRMLLHAVQAARHAGRLRPAFENVELAAQTFWAGVHGVVSLEIVKGHDAWIDWTPVTRRVKAMVDALIAGICTTAVAEAPHSKPRGKR